MLHEFLSTNRSEILRHSWDRVTARSPQQRLAEALRFGVQLFLDDLIATLRTGGDRSDSISRDATLHGERLQKLGFAVAQVVHGYGDVCQVVTQLAIEAHTNIDVDEFRILNRCLDDAIAFAVTEHGRLQDVSNSTGETDRLGVLAHELRNSLQTAEIAYQVLRAGQVAIGGSTGEILGRSLATLHLLVDRSLVQVRLDAGIRRDETIDVPSFLEETAASGSLAALERGVSLTVDRGDLGVTVEGDRHLLRSAVSNLLQNAFKFTPDGGHVQLRSVASPARVVIEVQDECEGLEPSGLPTLFDGRHKHSRAKTGMGLGLVISRRAIEAMGGTLTARNHPEAGCVFTVDLPRLQAAR